MKVWNWVWYGNVYGPTPPPPAPPPPEEEPAVAVVSPPVAKTWGDADVG